MKLVCFLMFLTGCSLFIGGSTSTTAKGTYYKTKFGHADWILAKSDSSDFVFENKKDGRILLSNSFCKEFQEEPLEFLAKKTFKTVNDLKLQRQEATFFHGRDAYRMEGMGNVDGVEVSLKLLNTRRNNCYFDFVSISPKNVAVKNDPDFESFLQSVEFK